ncbi:MAG: polynucleotide adenylyltransferase PcnB [Burkholderiales bacterium]
MIRKLIRRVFKAAKNGKPRIIPLKAHGVSRDQLSPCALKTTGALQQAGYAAFVVGGAVRDLLMGKTPKDFDVATNATPEEVRNLFRRSRIIGRRFRLVHVMCGSETIEVSTFRACENGVESSDRQSDVTGRIVRDNIFGSQVEDAVRRDFTVNALYYDPASEEIWDYHNGAADLKDRVLRMIGDPATRYREDPVRMLRAVRFAARFDFHIDPATRAPVAELGGLLQNVPDSRLFDEMLKLLLSGHALRGVHQLRAEGLHHGVMPLLDTILEQPSGERFITLALKNTDQRIAQGKTVSPGFLFATLLWHEVLADWNSIQAGGEHPMPALFQAMDSVLGAQEQKLAIPRRYDAVMKEIWAMQPRFLQRAGARPFRLLEHPRFRAGFDFFALRCESGELDMDLLRWWESFMHADSGARERMLVADAAGGPKKRRRRRRKPAGEAAAPEAAE